MITKNCELYINVNRQVITQRPEDTIYIGNFIRNSAERERFELSIPEGITVFETAAFDHSATSPEVAFSNAGTTTSGAPFTFRY